MWETPSVFHILMRFSFFASFFLFASTVSNVGNLIFLLSFFRTRISLPTLPDFTGHTMCLVRRMVIQTCMRPPLVVMPDDNGDAFLCFLVVLINLFRKELIVSSWFYLSFLNSNTGISQSAMTKINTIRKRQDFILAEIGYLINNRKSRLAFFGKRL